MLKGNLDIISLYEVVGWAQDDARPDAPVSLLITDNDQLIGRVLANRYRTDLHSAGIGNGRHSFALQFPTILPSGEKHTIRVFRESDGIDLPRSPFSIEPADAFSEAARKALADVIWQCGTDRDLTEKIDFLIDQIDVLLQKHADLDCRRLDRNRYRLLLQRWRRSPRDMAGVDGPLGGAALPHPPQRALVIDDRIPRSERDAGSFVVLSHVASLRRLGYEVVFAAAGEFATGDRDSAVLDAVGAKSCSAPYYGSIEELLRRQADGFDLVYLHRVSIATKYGELARFHNPRARRIYSAADLSYVRPPKQPPEQTESTVRNQWARFIEYVAAVSADTIITLSTLEAEALAQQVHHTKIHTVLWSITLRPTRIPFAERRGVAFIGDYAVEADREAARWLISEIMPAVRKRNPGIECLLVGGNMPDELRELCSDGVTAVGNVDALSEIFDRVRLTVAPFTIAAGIRATVIESFGAALPCVCTPIAVAGLDLPPTLQSCIGGSAVEIAALICKLHDNETVNDTYGRAGHDYAADVFASSKLDAAMRLVIGPTALPPQAVRAGAKQAGDSADEVAGGNR